MGLASTEGLGVSVLMVSAACCKSCVPASLAVFGIEPSASWAFFWRCVMDRSSLCPACLAQLAAGSLVASEVTWLEPPWSEPRTLPTSLHRVQTSSEALEVLDLTRMRDSQPNAGSTKNLYQPLASPSKDGARLSVEQHSTPSEGGAMIFGGVRGGGMDETPNVRAEAGPTAGRQARAGENVPRTTSPGLVACRWASPRAKG